MERISIRGELEEVQVGIRDRAIREAYEGAGNVDGEHEALLVTVMKKVGAMEVGHRYWHEEVNRAGKFPMDCKGQAEAFHGADGTRDMAGGRRNSSPADNI